jgi:hypothetical protein
MLPLASAPPAQTTALNRIGDSGDAVRAHARASAPPPVNTQGPQSNSAPDRSLTLTFTELPPDHCQASKHETLALVVPDKGSARA